ncbi:hypothetical protein K2V58_03290 [Staphylococcus arlettae]|uniref:ComF family protein n=1 Tax=Staphylococcus arlettae TaxID=29378 RepID=UPI001E3D2AFB|nr:hypothetical protein [Staphylococcus arlettae]MCD8833339.1 hypothetical protein [Staphylococcus arlettae]
MVNCLWCDAQINEALTITNFYARPVLICEACDDALQQCKIQTKACCTTCLKPISDNQSQCMHVKYTNCLTMQYDRKQSSLTKRQRLSQPNPFIITADLDFTNKNILLVDDIYTTGITVHQAACKFFVRKIRKFDVFAFAR